MYALKIYFINCFIKKALSPHWVDFWRENTVTYFVFCMVIGFRVCALTKHLSFLYFPCQFAGKKFQLKSNILHDSAIKNKPTYPIFY